MNFSEMKRKMAAKTPFYIQNHTVHPEMIGQIRIPNVIQTNAVYSLVKDDVNNPANSWNDGKGIFMQYKKAALWDFITDAGGIDHCIHYKTETKEQVLFEFVFLT